MKKPVSPARIAANRRNSLKSTGPKTPKGKQAIKWNALKHGMLAEEVIIPAGDGKEDKSEFQALLASLVHDLHPDGILEEMLVEKIAVCYWRLRRARRFEVGSIRNALDTFSFDKRVSRFDAFDSFWSPKERHFVRTAAGVQKLLDVLASVENHVQEDYGELCNDCIDRLMRWFCDDDNDWGETVAYFCWVMYGGPEKSPTDFVGGERPSPKLAKEYVLDLLDQKKEALALAMNVAVEHEELHDTSEMASLSLPDSGAADRLLRYETAIERQFYRAINELERLQRRRQGEAVPPPLNVELDTGN